MKLFNSYSWLLLLVGNLLYSCDLKDNEVLPSDSFVRIYETNEFHEAYIPMDVQPTEDGGYMILAGLTVPDAHFPAAYLLKVDREGKVEWEHLSETYVNPVSDLIAAEPNQFVFVAMDKQQLGTHLVRVRGTADGEAPTASVAYFDTYSYPLAAAPVQGGYAILHWNRDNKSSIQLSRLSNTTQQWTKSYNIYEDVESQVMGHLTRQRLPLIPFQVGSSKNGALFFNGFNNYTLSLTFVNGQNGEQTGVVNGARYASGISQVVPLAEGKFAMASFKAGGENIYSPLVSINTSEVFSAKDLSGNELPELTPYAKVKIRQVELKGEKITIYASTTRNGQITLFAYDEEGVLKGTQYLGAGNRFEMGDLSLSPDGGMVVLGRVFVAGRFPRLCLFKLKQQEVNSLLR